ncbi:MAG TPA: EamA family transporter [Chitinophagaceae bacterium]|nr:EamA family transporter [Chitinophagaceae bacterium]
MNERVLHWVFFVALAFIWGSSFILMKEGMAYLSAYQVASIRILSSGLVLLPVAIRHFRNIPIGKVGYIFLSGLLGSLLPAYLFCMAEVGIDSSLAGTLNSLTPIFVILIGILFFGMRIRPIQVLGVLLAFTGSILLYLAQPGYAQSSQLLYLLMVVAATACYGLNVNMVHRHLAHIPSMQIAALALTSNAIPAALVLWLTGYFQMDLLRSGVLISTGFSCILGVLGTALASVIFYILIKRAGAVFSSMVTYGIPFVAIFWGILYNEEVGWKQLGGLLVILMGVYLANKPAKAAAPGMAEK